MKNINRRSFLRLAGRYSIAGLTATSSLVVLNGCLTSGSLSNLEDIASKMESALATLKQVRSDILDMYPWQGLPIDFIS